VVVGASWQILSNFRPLVTEFNVPPDDGSIFLRRPLILLDAWVQVVVPPFTALLPNSSWQGFSDVAPVLGTELGHIFREFLVFFVAPRTLYHRGVQYFLPPMEALDVGALVQEGCNAFPVFRAKLGDQLGELLVFFCVPVSLRVCGTLNIL